MRTRLSDSFILGRNEHKQGHSKMVAISPHFSLDWASHLKKEREKEGRKERRKPSGKPHEVQRGPLHILLPVGQEFCLVTSVFPS